MVTKETLDAIHAVKMQMHTYSTKLSNAIFCEYANPEMWLPVQNECFDRLAELRIELEALKAKARIERGQS